MVNPNKYWKWRWTDRSPIEWCKSRPKVHIKNKKQYIWNRSVIDKLRSWILKSYSKFISTYISAITFKVRKLFADSFPLIVSCWYSVIILSPVASCWPRPESKDLSKFSVIWLKITIWKYWKYGEIRFRIRTLFFHYFKGGKPGIYNVECMFFGRGGNKIIFLLVLHR